LRCFRARRRVSLRTRRCATFSWPRCRVEPLDLDDWMNLPGRGAPGIMIAVARDGTNGGADVLRVVVVLVVPQEVAGQPAFLGLVPGRFVSDIRAPKERRQLLNPDAIVINRVLGRRRNL